MESEINPNNIHAIITDVWSMVKIKIESGYPLSSEKSLVFLFSYCLIKYIDPNVELVVDFESQPYNDLQGKSKYLDLIIYTNEVYKVAIEFKLPKKSTNGSSNQTDTRLSLYRDVARLNYLVTKGINEIKIGIIIFACNESSYLNNKDLKKQATINYKTREGYVFDSRILSSELIDEIPLPTLPINFNWDPTYFDEKNGYKQISGKFAYLNPIFIG
ncbi:hypothetical protein OM416_27610 [Paenibacillus sp. LS1]|uniref:hypothetical protein n=1 Tax=Paenibacillus sp. LS1 TaxID=2992120 RepID=UPI00222EDFBB|nr:hypothetical protein [Paenibacillus sp. LS1]MCW3795379.1 hypothetical protein [Paenibacillus sp. LS1]